MKRMNYVSTNRKYINADLDYKGVVMVNVPYNCPVKGLKVYQSWADLDGSFVEAAWAGIEKLVEAEGLDRKRFFLQNVSLTQEDWKTPVFPLAGNDQLFKQKYLRPVSESALETLQEACNDFGTEDRLVPYFSQEEALEAPDDEEVSEWLVNLHSENNWDKGWEDWKKLEWRRGFEDAADDLVFYEFEGDPDVTGLRDIPFSSNAHPRFASQLCMWSMWRRGMEDAAAGQQSGPHWNVGKVNKRNGEPVKVDKI